MKIRQPGAHLDHLLRQTRSHHVQLSSMADLKANILMTLASVVITLSVGKVVEPELKWTALVLMFFSFLTIVLAAYSVMPKIPFSLGKKPLKSKSSAAFNLLFFGDFAGMGYDEFESEMETVLNDDSKTYEVQVKEIYTLGTYLAKKKYRYIRLAYIAFISGLFLSGIILLFSGVLF